METAQHPDNIKATLEKWHEMVLSKKLEALPTIVHPDAVFRSPMAHTPYQSAMALCVALNTVITVFENFQYHRTLASADGLSAVLEFSAEVNGKKLKGIDLLQFDETGLITEMEVMVRPMSGLVALGEEMGKRLGSKLKAFT